MRHLFFGGILCLLLGACGGTGGGGEDYVYGVIVYVDSTSISPAVSDSLSITCVPGVSSVERIGLDRFRLKGMQQGQRYKVSVKFGLGEQLLATETIYKTGQEIVLRIPKSVQAAVRPVDTREGPNSRDGRVIKENR